MNKLGLHIILASWLVAAQACQLSASVPSATSTPSSVQTPTTASLPGELPSSTPTAAGVLTEPPTSLPPTPTTDAFILSAEKACAAGEKLVAMDDFQGEDLVLFQPLPPDFMAGWEIVDDPEKPGNRILQAYQTQIFLTVDIKNRDNLVRRLWFMFRDQDLIRFVIGLEMDPPNGFSLDLHTDWMSLSPTGGKSVDHSPGIIPGAWHLLEILSYQGFAAFFVDGVTITLPAQVSIMPDVGKVLFIDAQDFSSPEGYAYYDNLSICELSGPFKSMANP